MTVAGRRIVTMYAVTPSWRGTGWGQAPRVPGSRERNAGQ